MPDPEQEGSASMYSTCEQNQTTRQVGKKSVMDQAEHAGIVALHQHTEDQMDQQRGSQHTRQ